MSTTARAGLLDRVVQALGAESPLPPSLAGLDALHRAYLTRVPFENATKLVKAERAQGPDAAIRGAVEFWEDHLRWGSGGTCFASTYAYHFLLRYLGYDATFLFCHLPAEKPQAHGALLVQLPGQPVLVDVGYAIPTPLPLPATGSHRRETPYYDVEIRRGPGGEYLVFSEDDRGQRFRYRFSVEVVREARFLDAWRDTFRPDAPYMRRLALGRFTATARHLYKDANVVFEIDRRGERPLPVPPPVLPALSEHFSLPLPLLEAAEKALARILETR